jgi:NADPH-dependent curcumin reductase CurA
MMPAAPTQVRLAEYVAGIPGDDAWAITHDAPPDLADGEVEIDVRFVSVDPGMKGWSTPIRSYIPAVEPGEVMRAFGIGPVVRSASRHFAEGDVVTGFTGVQSRAVVGQGWLRPVDVDIAPSELHLSVLGMTGFTGYFGCSTSADPSPGRRWSCRPRPAPSAPWPLRSPSGRAPG